MRAGRGAKMPKVAMPDPEKVLEQGFFSAGMVDSTKQAKMSKHERNRKDLFLFVEHPLNWSAPFVNVLSNHGFTFDNFGHTACHTQRAKQL